MDRCSIRRIYIAYNFGVKVARPFVFNNQGTNIKDMTTGRIEYGIAQDNISERVSELLDCRNDYGLLVYFYIIELEKAIQKMEQWDTAPNEKLQQYKYAVEENDLITTEEAQEFADMYIGSYIRYKDKMQIANERRYENKKITEEYCNF